MFRFFLLIENGLQVDNTGDTEIGQAHLIESGIGIIAVIAYACSEGRIPVDGKGYRFRSSGELNTEFYDAGRTYIRIVFPAADIDTDTGVQKPSPRVGRPVIPPAGFPVVHQ